MSLPEFLFSLIGGVCRYLTTEHCLSLGICNRFRKRKTATKFRDRIGLHKTPYGSKQLSLHISILIILYHIVKDLEVGRRIGAYLSAKTIYPSGQEFETVNLDMSEAHMLRREITILSNNVYFQPHSKFQLSETQPTNKSFKCVL